jgi:hypothetical protein
MKFKQYLSEKVIVTKAESDSIISIIDNIVRKKIIGTNLEDLYSWIDHVTDRICDIFNEELQKHNVSPKVVFLYDPDLKTMQKYVPNAITRYPSNLEIYLSSLVTESIEDLKKGNDKRYKEFISELAETLEHEIIHLEQKRRAEVKNKDFIQTYPETRQSLFKKFGSKYYYHDKQEMMTHAHDFIFQLHRHGYTNDKILKILDNVDKNMGEIRKYALTFEDFYMSLQNYPKEWKKFVKYIKDYLKMDTSNET